MNTLIKEPTKGELTNKGFTNLLKISEDQTKQSLLAYGFTNHHKPSLTYGKMVDHNTSFTLTVSVETLKITDIDILNEDYLQPYDYQSEILNGNHSGKARNTFNKVNNILSKLQKDGVIKGFEKGMYI